MILFVLLALDVAGGATGDLSPDATAVVALILAVVAIVSAATNRPIP